MRAREATLADTALTTQRPFYHPVALKQLAGMGFHPERRSALHERHAALGAKFMTVGGWQRPEYYRLAGLARTESISRKCARCAKASGSSMSRTLGKIEISGPDAGAFLDRVYAGSFRDLRVGMTRYGLLLDEGGIVRDDGVIARLGEQRYYFTTTTSGAANVYRELLLWNARWRMDCAFVNATGHRAAFNLAGPRVARCCSRSPTSTCPKQRFRSWACAKGRSPASPREYCAPGSSPRWASRFTCRIDRRAAVGRL